MTRVAAPRGQTTDGANPQLARYTRAVSEDRNEPSRRRLLQALGTAALAATTVGCGSSCGGAPGRRGARPATSSGAAPGASPAAPVGPLPRVAGSRERPRVVVVTAPRTLTSGYDADRGVLGAMLAAGLRALTDAGDPRSALRQLCRPQETVGLKINGLAGRQAATHVELVEELAKLLQAIGTEPQRRVVFDRFGSDLVSSGFAVGSTGTYLGMGNEALGYEDEPSLMPSTASRLARVVTRRVDAIINLPVLKQHMLSGFTGALKNHFGCIDNPNKMHLDRCDPYIAEVNALPVLRQKQRLIVMDALRPVIDRGPSYQPGMGEVANALLFGTDPVATDTVALELLEALRQRRGLPPLAKVDMTPTHIATAATMGLGVNDRERIEVIKVEVKA